MFPDVAPGHSVLYIGAGESGTDIDCVTLADLVGPTGLVLNLVTQSSPEAQAYPNVTLFASCRSMLPLKANAMDWVIANRPLRMGTNDTAMWHELMRVLKPGGRLSVAATLAETPSGLLWSPRLEALKVYPPSVVAEVTVAPAEEGDLPAVQALLRTENLPVDVAPHLSTFVVARHHGTVVGCVGLESYGAYGVFRSFVVAPAYRRSHLGQRLRQARIEMGTRLGMHKGYGLTSTIAHLVEAWGFRRVDRSHIPPRILATSEFQADRCASAVTVCWDFTANASTP